MTLHEEQERVRKAVSNSLSYVQEDPWLTQRVLANAKGEEPVRRKIYPALVLSIVLMMGTFTAFAAINTDVNAWLYEQWPDLALMLMPVNLTSTSQGIEMEVISAVVKDHEALITYSLKDLAENRIDRYTQPDMNLFFQGISETGSSFTSPYYEDNQGKYIFSEHFNFGCISSKNDFLTVNIDSIQNCNHTEVDLLPLLNSHETEVKVTDLPADAKLSDGRFPEGRLILESDNSRQLSIGGKSHVFLTGVGIAEGELHVQYHVIGNERKTIIRHGSGDSETEYSYTAVRPWVNLLDEKNQCAFKEAERITWAGNSAGRDDYWEEWIFTLSRELTESMTFTIQVDEYEPPLFGDWKVDIPLRIVKNQ